MTLRLVQWAQKETFSYKYFVCKSGFWVEDSSNICNIGLKEVNKQIDSIGELKARIDDLKEKVSQYESRLPTKKEISSILNHLSALASQEDIKITGIRELETIKGEMQEGEQAYSGVPIEINMKSGYHQLGKFINEIENSDRLMKIDDLEIKSTSENLTEHDVKLIISSFVLVKEWKRIFGLWSGV